MASAVTSFEAVDYSLALPPKAKDAQAPVQQPVNLPAVKLPAVKLPAVKPPIAPASTTGGLLWGAVAVGIVYALLRGK